MNHKQLKHLIILLFPCILATSGSSQISIIFQVDLSYQIEQGRFNKNTEWVEVAGTFNGWNGSGRFKDDTENGIYELIIDGFQKGDNIAYKFRFNGQWDGREEFPGLGNDRTHTVGDDGETLYHWYNNETPPDADLIADFNVSLREFYEEGIISFDDRSSGTVTEWEWTFEGGTPNVSTAKNPVVKYEDPGIYSVQLTVKKGDQTNTIVLDDYLTVLPRAENNIPWWNETVFYEIFVRSFKDSDGDGIGDFKGLTQQLDYLNDGDPSTTEDLGITGIWLMPIHEAGSYHGYDVIDYQSVDSDFGGMADFKEFLEEAHKRGIKVIIDFVINHNSSQSDWFKNAMTGPNAEYRNFYRWSTSNPNYDGPWGQRVWHERNGSYYYGLFWDGMPDLNYEEPRVKEAIFKAADFWLSDIGIDGFRLDAVKYIVEEDQKLEDTQGTYQFWKDFTEHIKTTKADAFSVGEAWTNTNAVINYVKDDRIDYCFEFDLAWNIQQAVNESRVDNLYAQVQKMYNIYPHLQYGTFLANHDQNRIFDTFNKSESKIKLAAALYLTLPGIPYLYYGEEIGMSGVKPDEDIRRPMQWDNTTHAGFTTGTPWRGIPGSFSTYNVAKETTDPSSLLSTYRDLIHLRNQENALQKGTYEALTSEETKLFAFIRKYEGEEVLVIHNMGSSEISNIKLSWEYATLSNGNRMFLDLLSESAPIIVSIANQQLTIPISLAGRSTKVFKLTQTVSTESISKLSTLSVHPNPVQDQLTIVSRAAIQETLPYQVVDIQGKIVGSGLLDLSNSTTNLSTSTLSNGWYQLLLFNREGVERLSFVKGR